jgi:hypothetical protein
MVSKLNSSNFKVPATKLGNYSWQKMKFGEFYAIKIRKRLRNKTPTRHFAIVFL